MLAALHNLYAMRDCDGVAHRSLMELVNLYLSHPLSYRQVFFGRSLDEDVGVADFGGFRNEIRR